MNWGYTVVTAEDGEEALGILESEDAPPLAILDWMMPKMDGLEVCAGCASTLNRPYVYLVLLTAKSQKEEIAAGLQAGADDYVIKPFDPDELRARLTVGQRVVVLERALARKVGGPGSSARGCAEVEEFAADLHVLQVASGTIRITGTRLTSTSTRKPAPIFPMGFARTAWRSSGRVSRWANERLSRGYR